MFGCVLVCVCVFQVLLRTTKLAQKYFQVVLRTTKLAESILPSTNLAHCTSKYNFLLQRSTKLAQSTSQCYFVLQSLHKRLPSTTLYYTACTKYFPVLLCTAQNTSQYYILWTTKLIKVLPSTTSYYKACAKYLPITCQNLGSSNSNAKWKPGSPNTMAQRKQPFKDHFHAALTLGNTRHRRREPMTASRYNCVDHRVISPHL